MTAHFLNGYYRMIQTDAGNIRPRGINKPVRDTSQTGINGTFFDATKDGLPPLGLYWYKYHGDRYNASIRNDNPNNKTLYGVRSGGTIIGKRGTYTDISDIFAKEGRDNMEWIISGKAFNEDSDYALGDYRLNRPRTIMGIVDTTSRTQIILAITRTNRTVPEVKQDIYDMGYDPRLFIMLDGGGSTTMKIGNVNYGAGVGRSISNMVSLIDDSAIT